MTNKEKIYNFFEDPQTWPAHLVQIVILIMIIGSVTGVVIEVFYNNIYLRNETLFRVGEYIVLASFTVEYLLRIGTAPKKWKFAARPLNIIDFLAVFPSYLELILPIFVNTTALRSLRLIRMLRFSKVLRLFKLFKYGKLLKKVLRYRGTILQSILPVIMLFVVAKTVVWILEYYGFWLRDANLGELFAIIGFALGIILSQKIASAYDKFLQVEDAAIRLYGTLRSLSIILDKIEPNLGTQISHRWAKSFLETLEGSDTNSQAMAEADAELYQALHKAEAAPAELAILHGDMVRDAAFCLSKKVRLTPKAYDTLLHQSTMLYLALITVFIPGLPGIISVVVAAYILYGMYNVTQDLDSIIGGEFDLININISELKKFADEK